MIFVDSNVLIDVSGEKSDWDEWSAKTLASSRAREPLVANAVVAAELAPRFGSSDAMSAFCERLEIALLEIDNAAAYRAGQAHVAYRRAGGERRAILADFLIAGHAAVLGAQLLTRDRGRFATYFPELVLIVPETEENG
jgi:predicted nucleic acid-binding protein